MKAIHKYPLTLQGEEKVSLPEGARILCVQNQRETICIWAVVDPDITSHEERTFMIIGTGHIHDSIPTGGYIGTVQLQDGFLVFHVFEKNS